MGTRALERKNAKAGKKPPTSDTKKSARNAGAGTSEPGAAERDRKLALDFHEFPRPGKLEIRPTKALANQRDLARAYSPGVAEACLAIKEDVQNVARFTARANLVAVISNGTAVLGLGDIGALASKPVMEGKAVLFKKFANIDCFDIEIDERDPERLAETICSLAPSFGAINLEDIKAPDCFIVEKICRERMDIPVFHDDQHGTAITVSAAAINAIALVGKKIEDIKIVSVGGGAAGIACLNMLIKLGAKRENIYLFDREGLIYHDRPSNMTPQKAAYANGNKALEMGEIIKGADFFLGLSGPGVLSEQMVSAMADKPIIFALANPTPEIMPEEARKAAPEAIIATGRSDYPNQVNNVLCFPFLFRGALDVGATTINDEMQLAAVHAIAGLAREPSSAEAAAAYAGENLSFGPEYLIPKPFDPRLLLNVASAVARAAIASGVAERPYADFEEYCEKLQASVVRTSMIMKPVFESARHSGRRIVFAEGEDARVIRTASELCDETDNTPILIGRPGIIEAHASEQGIALPERVEIVNPNHDPRYREYWESYHACVSRKGVTPDLAQVIMRTNTTAIAAVMVHLDHADSMICGTFGQYRWHLRYVSEVITTGRELEPRGALSMMLDDDGALFVGDTQMFPEPTPAQIAETVISAARHVRRFGLPPKIALCSHSMFGSLNVGSGGRMREALALLDAQALDFEYEGEMPLDLALDPELRQHILPGNRMDGAANVLIFANTDTASGVRNILKMRSGALEVGPILMGMGNKAQIVTNGITPRGLLNIAALAGTPVSQYG